MAIRHREGRKKPWEVYWNNPFTFKRESLYVGTKEEAKKQDALKKYQLKFERDLFRPAEEEAVQVEQTLEQAVEQAQAASITLEEMQQMLSLLYEEG